MDIDLGNHKYGQTIDTFYVKAEIKLGLYVTNAISYA